MSFGSKILFIDRDGTLIQEPADFQIDSYEKFSLLPGVIPSLIRFKEQGYRLVMVTNQDGLGTAKYPQEAFDRIQTLLLGILESQGIRFEEILICPHFPEDRCPCRKPSLYLVRKYLADTSWDRTSSAVIGDRQTDLQLAESMGIRGFLLNSELDWKKIAIDLLDQPRRGESHRKTRETDILVQVNLDGEGQTEISTGIGFFDHMLDQIGRHSGMDLRVQVKGDLHIDEHHTVEDTALALGAALKRALGDKIGIQRFGFNLPMDDAQARVAVDLSGRAYSRFDAELGRESVGGLSTEMVPHFFRSLADGLSANIHVTVDGENTHHQVESCFKAFGRALGQAIEQSGHKGIPSTKGTL